MIKSTITATFQSDLPRVWNVVTDNRCTDWRSDLSRVECSPDGRRFTEYTLGGSATYFTITRLQLCRCYAFEMENRHLQGRWIGYFRQTAGGTEVQFAEEVEVKNPLTALFARGYLKKQQRRYVEDLRKALGETSLGK